MKILHLLIAVALLPMAAFAELKLPSIISSNMVLQQKKADLIWGWDKPGTEVTVAFAGQQKKTMTEATGYWELRLDPLDASAEPRTMTISGSEKIELTNILVGEVWMCSGQSNMRWTLGNSWDADLEIATAKLPNIRLINVPNVGTQEIQEDFVGKWEPCSPANAGAFSAVGFFFGRTLFQFLDVPVGLINNAWGGSAAEAWVRRDVLDKEPRFAETMARWRQTEATYDYEKVKANHAQAMEKWKEAAELAKKENKPAPKQPRNPQNSLAGQQRPGNIYAGFLHSHIKYGIKGVIWYQGESNSGRAHEYRELFPFMINFWRKEAQQGDFPFYWVQLADFMAEKPNAGDSSWAELREAQTLTQKLPNTGQAVIIDLGEANDIHPKNKRDVADRLVRWALVKDYGAKLPYRSPEFKSAEFKENKATVTIDTFGSRLRTVDVSELKGFAVCGEDRQWKWADAKFVLNSADKIEVSSKEVAKPVAVRYAWADNPVCNVYSVDGLPLTPFRSDDFPMVTAPKPVAATAAAPAKPAAPAPNTQKKTAQ